MANQVTNIFALQDEIIALLKTELPEYSKNILPLFADEEILNNANFSPSIFVLYLGLKQIESTNMRTAIQAEQTWGIYTVFRDARGMAKNNMVAGEIMVKVMQLLQGKKFTGYTPMTLSDTPRQYTLDNTGAVCYPILFKNSFAITGK